MVPSIRINFAKKMAWRTRTANGVVKYPNGPLYYAFFQYKIVNL